MRLVKDPDLLLLHPPSVYDFRKMLIIPGPLADLVPSGLYFEMYPIGLFFIGEYLERHGISTRIFNLAVRMLEQPSFDVEGFLRRSRPLAFGIDFHWLPHCHGALEIARLCKEIHPDIPVILGGYSASTFHRELMDYRDVDYVVRGDSTEEPVRLLLSALSGKCELADVPNLTYRDSSTGKVLENPLSYVPGDLSHLGDIYRYAVRSAARYMDIRGIRAFKGFWSNPMTMVLTCRGCTYNCSFCAGSAETMSRCFGRQRPAFREPDRVVSDIETIIGFTGAPVFVVGDLRQNGDEYAGAVLDGIKCLALKNRVVLELFEPAPRDFFERLGECLPNYGLEISPESHDEEVKLATGKTYTNEEVEQNVRWALDNGCKNIDVFFMIGLPMQTQASVMDTVAYCYELLQEFGPRVSPLVAPLGPFLDVGCIAHSKKEEYGYEVLLHTLEDYRKALLNPHWRDMLGYETRWMTRQEIVDSTYAALLELNRVKGESGQVSSDLAEEMELFLRDNIALLNEYDSAMRMERGAGKDKALAGIKRKADLLMQRSSIVKEEITWPIAGRKFRYTGVLRMIASRSGRSRTGATA